MIEYHKARQSKEEVEYSIIIPTWNNLLFLKNCINSIRKHSTRKFQIVVHVNCGEDGTVDYLKEEGISFSYSTKNIGVCEACNSAYSLCEGEYILYLNDDMYVLPEWDHELLEVANSYNHKNFYLSGTLIEPHETPNQCVLSPFNYGDTLEDFKEQELLNSVKDLKLKKVDWNGSTWPPSMMHRSLWDRIGGFSVEYYPGYYSDPDISQKLWSLGVREFRGVGKSLIYHFMSKSTGRFKKKPGYKTFVGKWGMTARFFTNNFLKIGTDYKGILPEFENTGMLKKEKLRSFVKLFV